MTKIFAGVGIYTEEFFKLKNLTRHKIGLKKQEIKFLKEVSVLTWRDPSRVKMARNFVFVSLYNQKLGKLESNRWKGAQLENMYSAPFISRNNLVCLRSFSLKTYQIFEMRAFVLVEDWEVSCKTVYKNDQLGKFFSAIKNFTAMVLFKTLKGLKAWKTLNSAQRFFFQKSLKSSSVKWSTAFSLCHWTESHSPDYRVWRMGFKQN